MRFTVAKVDRSSWGKWGSLSPSCSCFVWSRSTALLVGLSAVFGLISPSAGTQPGEQRQPVLPEPLSAVADNFSTRVLQDHPLVGTLWDAQSGNAISVETLTDRVVSARTVLVGEKHDNPDHHRLQAAVTAELAAVAPTIVVFEMIPTDRQLDLQQYLQLDPSPSAARIGDAVGWEELGWSPWRDYQAIAAAALNQTDIPAQLALRAGNAPRSLASANQTRVLTAEEEQLLRLDIPLEETLQQDLEQQIIASHCGMIPKEVAPKIARIQRVRDAWMAREMVRAQMAVPESRVVMIAGGGHTRQDRGIPWYLRQVPGGSHSLTIRAVEVIRDVFDPKEYFGPSGAEHIIFFTPRVDETDPCDAFRRSVE